MQKVGIPLQVVPPLTLKERGNVASGVTSHAEGGAMDPAQKLALTTASGSSSHAEGIAITATGFAAHAEGGTSNVTLATGPQALGDFSHAEGQLTQANGVSSHAGGYLATTTVNGDSAYAEGDIS